MNRGGDAVKLPPHAQVERIGVAALVLAVAGFFVVPAVFEEDHTALAVFLMALMVSVGIIAIAVMGYSEDKQSGRLEQKRAERLARTSRERVANAVAGLTAAAMLGTILAWPRHRQLLGAVVMILEMAVAFVAINVAGREKNKRAGRREPP